MNGVVSMGWLFPNHIWGMPSGYVVLISLAVIWMVYFVALAAIRPWFGARRQLSPSEAAIMIGDERRAVVAALAYLRVSGTIAIRDGKLATARFRPRGCDQLEAAVYYAIGEHQLDSIDAIMERTSVRQSLPSATRWQDDEPSIFPYIRRIVTVCVALVTVVVGFAFVHWYIGMYVAGLPATVAMLLADGEPWPRPLTRYSRALARFPARMAAHRDKPLNECDPVTAAGLVAAYGEDLLWDADPELRAVLARPHDDYYGRHRVKLVA